MSWAKITPAAKHLGLSPRTTRGLLKQGLPHSRLPSGTILIELEAADEWLRGFNVGRGDLQKIGKFLEGLR